MARVAEALAYAHKQNVVHRDIKPANIMYDMATDTVKVTDFGIARITDSSKTKTGLVLGTPSFMSPEQIAGKKVDGRSDLYSLGVMLFQMLAGVLPFRGDSMAELMYKIANEPAPDIRIIRKELPDSLADIVALTLQKRSEVRYQDGDQLALDLRAVMAAMSGVVMAVPPAAVAMPVTPTFAAAGMNLEANKTTILVSDQPTGVFQFEATTAQPAIVPAAVASTYDATEVIYLNNAAMYDKTAVIDVGAPVPATETADAGIKLKRDQT